MIKDILYTKSYSLILSYRYMYRISKIFYIISYPSYPIYWVNMNFVTFSKNFFNIIFLFNFILKCY